MKTKLVSLIMVCMIAVSLFVALPVSAEINLLTTNPNFESSTAVGWSLGTTSEWDIGITTSVAHSGVRSLRMEAVADETAANHTLTYNSCPALTIGQYYIFSAWINIPTWKGIGGFKMRVTQAAAPTETYSGDLAITTESGWRKVSVTFMASSEKPQLRLVLVGGTGKGSIVYVDDIAVAPLKEYYDEKYAKEFCNVEEYGNAKNGVVSTYPMDEISKWVSNNTTIATISVDQNVKMQGTGSMRIDVGQNGSTYVNWSSSRPYLSEVKEYEVSVWIYIPKEYEENITSVHLYAEAVRIKNAAGKNTYQTVPTPTIKSTNGTWQRISGVITPEAARVGQMAAFRLDFVATGTAKIYMDDLKIVEKAVQYPVLQLLKPVKDTAGNDVLLDTKTIGAGAFALRYDEHVANASSVGKTFIAAIYKTETDGTKRLVEVKLDTFAASEKELTLSFNGIETPDNTYSVEVMLWDNIAQKLTGIKHGTYKLV